MIVSINKKTNDSIIPEHSRAAGVIPVLACDDENHVFLMDDQSIGFGFICRPLAAADDKIQDRVNGFINQEFPAKTTIQLLLFRSPDINRDMYDMQALRDNHRDPLLDSVLQERVDFLYKHTTDRLYSHTRKGIFDNGVIQDTKLIVTCKVPIHGHAPTNAEQTKLVDLKTKVEASLQTIGLAPMALDANGYVRLMNTIMNWDRSAAWRSDSVGWEQDKPICEQVFDYSSDLETSRDGIRLGDQYAKVLSAKKLPSSFYFGDALSYVGDLTGGNNSVKENYMVAVNIFIPDPEKTKTTLERKRQFAVNQAYGPLLKFVPVLADKKEGFDTLYDSMKEGAKPIRMSFSLVLFAPTKDRVDAAATSAMNSWREMKFSLMEDKFVALPMFVNSLPLCTDRKAIHDLFRYKTMTTEQAAVLLPVFGEWKGTGTYHASLVSRNGQLMSLSLHDSDTNKNLVIAAESGSGKSFLINELIVSYLSEGAQVWVIDAGKSYKKMLDMLGGDMMQFDEHTDIGLNPFELVKDYEDEEDSVVSMVCAMASAKGLLSEWQVASLKQVMAGIWAEHGQSMKVDHIAERCLESEDQRLRDVGAQLYPFTSKGSYGKYFLQNNIDFKEQFTVLELDELQGRKHLRLVVLLQLIYQIQQEVFLGDRDRKKIVIVDEAWDLLKQGEVSVFMEEAYRKFRKYGGSVVIATQSINDLYSNTVGQAIAENSANMYLLGQTEETVESVRRDKRLALSEGGFHMLKTVHTIQGVYSEIFIKSKSGVGVGRLVVGDFQKLLYSTAPEDIHDIEQFTKQGMSTTDAIRAVLVQRQQAA